MEFEGVNFCKAPDLSGRSNFKCLYRKMLKMEMVTSSAEVFIGRAPFQNRLHPLLTLTLFGSGHSKVANYWHKIQYKWTMLTPLKFGMDFINEF